MMHVLTLSLFLLCCSRVSISNAWQLGAGSPSAKPTKENLDYDCIIIGAGASGMFASGATSMLGSKTLILDIVPTKCVNDTVSETTATESLSISSNNVGGDCTNFACVPSKAVRSAARMKEDFHTAQHHAASTVSKVKRRENPSAIVEHNPNLDLMLVSDCRFVSPQQIEVTFPNEFYSSVRSFKSQSRKDSTSFTFSSKKFLIATGASPIIPESFDKQARKANLPLHTYRTLYRPSGDGKSIWDLIANKENTNILIVGGGATALEIGQSLARLRKENGNVTISMVAPDILKGSRADDTLRDAAIKILDNEDIQLHLGNYLKEILPDKSTRLSDGTILPPVDAIIMCVGRNPNVESLELENADVDFDKKLGILVNNKLRSKSNRMVFASGDCCSLVAGKHRTAIQAAWTGYHAAANTRVPSFLRIGFRNSAHKTVPSVIYTDPELISVGLSKEECERKYGIDGFDSIFVPEENTDRADMESRERLTIGFVELRATKIYGKILGLTACGPSASELANEISLAIVTGLTVRDVAKSLHSYPSHGYLMYRAALALTMGSVWGSLEALGPVGGVLANIGRFTSSTASTIKKRTRFLRKRF
jgi:pyruvate/2-oxoglutarate dehydrogenase complex dihydrolipoamide dehydrogenase (E3) component